MQKRRTIVLILALCGLLSACGSSPTASADGGREAEAESPVVSPDTDGAVKAYVTALETLIRENIYPDGTDTGYDGTIDLADSQFAVYDVDQDGKDELLILFTSTYMAGMRGSVFDYDEEAGTLIKELSEFPALTFYDNGFVKAEASHNQGLAGEFWPYSLYRYHADSDSYELVAMMDAWDRRLSETDYQDRPFPEEVDKSKTGIVYYIMTDGSYDTSSPVDFADYNQWIDACIGDASETSIPYVNLTEENVSRLRP